MSLNLRINALTGTATGANLCTNDYFVLDGCTAGTRNSFIGTVLSACGPMSPGYSTGSIIANANANITSSTGTGALTAVFVKTTAGSYTWTAPAGLVNTCVLLVGGGGSGAWGCQSN